MKKKKFYGFLTQRIVAICLVLIVIPLILYSGLIWDRDWRIKLNTVFSQFELIGNSSLEIFKQWELLQFSELENFTRQINKDLSMKFIFNESLSCTFSTKSEMEGKKDFFPSMLMEANEKGGLVFAAINPYTENEEIFVLKKVGNEIRGLSVDAAQWAKKFVPNARFTLSLIGPNDQQIFTTESKHDQAQIVSFTLADLENWEKNLNFSKVHALRKNHLALRLKLPLASFDMQIEMSSQQITALEGGKLFRHILAYFLFLFVIGGIGTWWLVRRMAKPLHQLGLVMEAVEMKDYAKRYQKDRFGFEINTLGQHFNQMLERLLFNMEEAKNERVSRELLTKEFQIGRAVQEELLPKEIPQFPGLNFGLGFVPAQEVAGDFYDLFAIDTTHLMFVIADGSGKGISACLYSLIVRSMLRSYAQSEKSLSGIILQANNLFCHDTVDSGNFVTAWIGFYHNESRQLIYSSAGHLPALLLHPNGEIEELTTKGIALGATAIEEVEIKTCDIAPDNVLFLYTDGIIEAHNEKGELFGKSRLFDFLKGSHALEPQELINRLIKEIDRFSNKAMQHDDLTAVCFKTSSN